MPSDPSDELEPGTGLRSGLRTGLRRSDLCAPTFASAGLWAERAAAGPLVLCRYIRDWSVDRVSDVGDARALPWDYGSAGGGGYARLGAKPQADYGGGRGGEGRGYQRRLTHLVLRAVGPAVGASLVPAADGRVLVALSFTPSRVTAAVSVVKRFFKKGEKERERDGAAAGADAAPADEEDMGLRYARGPDGTRGFAKGTRPRAEAAREREFARVQQELEPPLASAGSSGGRAPLVCVSFAAASASAVAVSLSFGHVE